ncbi:hypothetical protein [Microlunatus sp. Gsoil 973]|uniref:hypothetical protein n=1 Tax=Microlunatus sp. Gsoil 973 TaxID=2672569 RepID=UPI0012B4821F|nr:hypothetical protein [Microlunatus sp. Gsoil 973]QGN34550.1 hypothetical protein GJV80_18915 [Microlunatus sp. Gsoil 973]
MARPLELSYNWRTPVGFASIGLIICVIVLARSRTTGWLGAIAGVVALWMTFMVVVWARTRALIELDGERLRVRRFWNTYLLDGPKVASVREYLTASGPSYKVRLTGDDKTYYVPSALLRSGHSTFFAWLLSHSSDAELDKGARKTLDSLRLRGLIE